MVVYSNLMLEFEVILLLVMGSFFVWIEMSFGKRHVASSVCLCVSEVWVTTNFWYFTVGQLERKRKIEKKSYFDHVVCRVYNLVLKFGI